jgi:hypothetical protein
MQIFAIYIREKPRKEKEVSTHAIAKILQKSLGGFQLKRERAPPIH